MGGFGSGRKPIHGHAKQIGGRQSPTYMSWYAMKKRCENPKSAKYPIYGARGIVVAEEFKKFEGFLKYLGERPVGMTIERIDNNGPYAPGNVRWASSREQARNRRNNHYLTVKGETRTIQEWSEIVSIKPVTILMRLRRGWPPAKVLQPIKGS